MEFDTKNEMGFYLGDKKGMKGRFHVYQPYYHKILTRGDVHRVRISKIELMEWYRKRAHVGQSGQSWGVVEEAIVDLLKDKPYMKASAPRPPVEDNDDTSDDSGQEDTGQVQQSATPQQLNPIRSYSQSRHDPSRSCEMEQDADPPANVSGQQAISRNRTAKASQYGKRTASLSEASTCWSNSTPTWRPTTTMTARPESRHSTAC